ncbi:hypothetical protein A2400_00840 [candidate division WS6 bacterium RIFOXYB1_FULL_33_14]|uniref:Nudix hydrolase domain-containing protein n=1 Tax=candidate division WS6 bacterium RIFOXYB1_FULL_33_14 TaxID=1817896 RepID=A0A1F4UGY4_9BACT|nr:MAG: hypothetical protein A2400_00840 [candidate division WS6 bacterium RIFOXYB1_FULL_33_14]
MTNKETLLRGDKENPYHLSIGQVIINNQNQIALIQKPDGVLTLPRETTYLKESFSEALERGAIEEIGITIKPIRFLGSLITSFNRDSETVIEKSTLYFLSEMLEQTEKKLEEDELEDTVIWINPIEAIEKLNEQENPEAEIVVRASGE